MKLLMAALWEKIQFWKRKSSSVKYKEDIDFQFIPSDDEQITGIGILKGKYAGVLYHYGKARVIEEGEFARLFFDYTIEHTPTFSVHDLTNDQEFHTMIGDILTDILLTQSNETIRDNDIKEFDI
jgi:hypothetical protein